MTKQELKALEKLLKLEYKKINPHVSINYDNKVIEIVNTKGGEASVILKRKTFEKIAKELGHAKKVKDKR